MKTFPTEPGRVSYVSVKPSYSQMVPNVRTERSCFDVYRLRQHRLDESPEHSRNINHHQVQDTLNACRYKGMRLHILPQD